jgi:heterodisulfide reductase subunit A
LRLNTHRGRSCTPRTLEALFRITLREEGLNPYLFELANIRDQCSWVHSPSRRTRQEGDRASAHVDRALAELRPLTGESLAINQNGLVLGGGVSGMTAALSLADQGFRVFLVEKSERLGGQLLAIPSTLESDDTASFIEDLVRRTERHKNITLFLNSEVTKVNGHIGKFVVSVSEKGKSNGKGNELACGAIVVATGAEPAKAAGLPVRLFGPRHDAARA